MEFFWDRKFLQFYFRNALEGKGSFASVGKVILPLNSWIPLRISGTRLPDNLHTGKKKKKILYTFKNSQRRLLLILELSDSRGW